MDGKSNKVIKPMKNNENTKTTLSINIEEYRREEFLSKLEESKKQYKFIVRKKYLRNWEKNMDISNYEVTLTDVAKEEIENIYAYILENLHEKTDYLKLLEN